VAVCCSPTVCPEAACLQRCDGREEALYDGDNTHAPAHACPAR
jgi:hypothetical protein